MSSSRNSAKEISSRSNEELKDAEKRVKDVDISNRETRRVRKGNEAHDETAEKGETRYRRPPFLNQFGNPE